MGIEAEGRRDTAAPEGTVAVAALAGFDLGDFASRWAAARRAACRAITGDAREDADALVRVEDAKRDDLLRAVFDHGRRFGASAARHFRVRWDLADFASLLPALGAPCFSGAAPALREASCVVERGTCTEWREANGFVCDYWRESLDGLVMGLSDDIFLSRHSSRGNGGASCVDVLYVESNVRANPGDHLAPLDPNVVEVLQAMLRRTLSARLALAVHGVSDGVVHYRLTGSAEDLSSAGAARLRQAIAATLAELPAPLRASDVSPRPVIMGAP